MFSPAEQYDVLIAGGGPAGTSAAIHLALRGARVLLAEQKRFPRPKLCGEFISPECWKHFARLGVLEEMRGAGGREVRETVFYSLRGRSVAVPSVWFGDGMARGGQSVALGLSRAEMDDLLLRRARAAGVEVWEDAQAAGLVWEDGSVGGARLKANGAELEVRARVTIDATGRTRALARRCEERRAEGAAIDVERDKSGPEHVSRNGACRPRLVAFKAHLQGAQGASGACEIYFYRGGYGGLSGVEGGLSNLCFIVRASDARACGGNAERLMREVVMANRRARAALSEAVPATQWLGVAIESFGRRSLAPAEGLLAAGDAASFIDPFTGSGMLMALESGEVAAGAILDWLQRDPANAPFSTLAADYRARYRERFAARLRLCSLLRRAAFAPPFVSEAAISAVGLHDGSRRWLARATRQK